MAITISGDTPNFSSATITTGTVTTLTAPTSTITTLNAPSGVLATQNGMSGICKAWAYFNGSTATISNSFNVSSITRNSTGQYSVNFTTAMPSATYSVVGMIPYASWGASVDADIYGGPTSTTVATINIIVPFDAYYDGTAISIAVFA